MKILISVLLLSILFSCADTTKYKYTKQGDDEVQIITAPNESLAAIKGYEKYCIGLAVTVTVANYMKEDWDRLDNEFEWDVLNYAGESINPLGKISLKVQDSLYQEIVAFRIGQESSIGRTKVELKENIEVKNKLLPYFNVKKDEFDSDGTTFYTPKSTSNYVNRNDIYLYIATNKYGGITLRLRLQYYADDWLFLEKTQFSIDGNAFTHIPKNIKTDHADGKVWEWSDDAISNHSLLNALYNSKSAKIKLIGRKYDKIKTVTKKQLDNIKRTIDLYKAMGGDY